MVLLLDRIPKADQTKNARQLAMDDLGARFDDVFFLALGFELRELSSTFPIEGLVNKPRGSDPSEFFPTKERMRWAAYLPTC
jgi:hypothetical protein